VIKIETKIEDYDSIDKYLDALIYQARKKWKEEKEQNPTEPEQKLTKKP